MTTFPSRLLAAAFGLALATAAHAQDWVGTWGVAPAGPPAVADAINLADQTLRLVVRTSIGGERVRIRLSNELGATPLRIGAAHIGVRAGGASVQPGTDRVLTFAGRADIVIPAGAPRWSDPVALPVAALSDLAISLYLPGTSSATTLHGMALQTQYVSKTGDFTGAATLPVARTLTALPFLTEVDVEATGSAIVTLGDSITDGMRSTVDANHRWPDWLARRLAGFGVVNRGISGNRLLTNMPDAWLTGRAILERFDRDVLATAGVRTVTLMVGINDIGSSSPADPVTAADLIAGYRQVIARAHAKGIAVHGATLIPFQGAGYYSAEKEAVRQAVNTWIRSGGGFDAVIDFDRVMRDPANPARMLAAYDSGDHLHPNDAGYEAMGNAVPLTLFRRPAPSLQ